MCQVYFCKTGRMNNGGVVSVPWHDLTHNTSILVGFVVIFYVPNTKLWHQYFVLYFSKLKTATKVRWTQPLEKDTESQNSTKTCWHCNRGGNWITMTIQQQCFFLNRNKILQWTGYKLWNHVAWMWNKQIHITDKPGENVIKHHWLLVYLISQRGKEIHFK